MEFILASLHTIRWETRGVSTSDTQVTLLEERFVALSSSTIESIGEGNLGLDFISSLTITEEIDEKRGFLEQIQSQIKNFFLVENLNHDTLREFMQRNEKQGEPAFMMLQQ